MTDADAFAALLRQDLRYTARATRPIAMLPAAPAAFSMMMG